MKYKHIILSTVLIFIQYLGHSQALELDLPYNPQQAELFQKEKTYPATKSDKTLVIDLPFIDDFSRYSLPTNNPNIPADWQRWTDNKVFINSTFPIDPPSIGVATFDGLDETGYPYNFNGSGGAHLPSDTLTSLPINLSGMNQGDHVYLSFYYQAKGLGNSPEINDSLKLEFKIGEDTWVTKWAIPGIESTASTPFQQVFIEVWDAQFGNFYFQDNFQFRFIGYSEQRGNLDHWHLDYVYMDENMDPQTFFLSDLAIVSPKNTLLNSDLTAMPWTHFIDNPEARMLNNTTILTERNLSPTDYNFRSGYKVKYQNNEWDFLNSASNTSNNVGIIETEIAINTGSNSFVFDTNVNDTCAAFDVVFYHEFVDNFTPQNDSTTFTQNFSNYYAYDDGSAEKAFTLDNAPGGKIAVKYNSFIPDTLLGIWVHFIPFKTPSTLQSFILRAWDDNNGEPGDELAENFVFHYPEYHHDGHNVFTYYEFDNPIPVSNTFYVGWVQQENQEIYVGMDKNTNTNSVASFYSIGGINAPWYNTNFDGSLMIRPVLRAGKTSTPSLSVENISETPTKNWTIYPNPVVEELHIDQITPQGEYNQISITDYTGRLVYQNSTVASKNTVAVDQWNAGIYFVQITNDQEISQTYKIIKTD